MSSQILVVELVEAKDVLPPKANSASTAFFCTIGVGGVRKKSKTVRNSLEPRWEQSFEFDVDGAELPPCVITMQDKGLFGSTGMGQVTIKTQKKLSGAKENDGWYPLQPSKSGKATSGALRIKLKLTKRAPSLTAVSNLSKKKSSVLSLSQPAADIFGFIDRNDWVGLDEFLERATPEQVNVQEPKTLNSPLHIACLQCKVIDERIIETLLNYEKIKIDLGNVDRNSPLYYFCAKWQSPDIRFLTKMIKLGADVNGKNLNGETPIFAAIFNESIRSLLLETLIEHGADVNVISAHGESILHYAVRLGRNDLVNMILTASPQLDVKGKDGLTPYQVALHYKFKGIPRQLKKAEELFNWLEANDLSDLKGVFLKNEIYKNLLADISESLLDKMGIEGGPIRKKILEACRRLEREEAEPDVLGDDENPGMDETKTAQLKGELALLSPESQSSSDGNQDWILDGKELEYLKRLGSGTSGDVYKGLYRGKHCAIKVLKEMTEDKEREEFKKEFHIMSSVHHPNIVHFFGASFKPKLCMVLEFCARGSLYHVLKDESNGINWERGLQMMKETVAGIDALHSNEPMIMHRDLKSLNLLVTDDWHIKVADFGLSRFDTAEALETLKQMRGTFAYCAPESYHGEKYSPKSDIYSMGIIFWELANRVIKGKYEQPYSEYKNIQFDFQIIIQAAKSDLRPTIPSTCPQVLIDVIKACTHKDRDERPDCKTLLTMIEACEKDYHANTSKWEATIVVAK